jgi:hypothetical protein
MPGRAIDDDQSQRHHGVDAAGGKPAGQQEGEQGALSIWLLWLAALAGCYGSVVTPTCFIFPSTMPYQATVR